MNTSNEPRSELLTALEHFSQTRPEWRMGQTLANLAMTAGRLDAGGVWDLEDEEALSAAPEAMLSPILRTELVP